MVSVGAGHARVCFPNENPLLRTDNNIISQALEASQMQKPVKGIKGPPMVRSIPHLNLSESFSPDYMHGVMLGVIRQFLFLWLDTSKTLNNGTSVPKHCCQTRSCCRLNLLSLSKGFLGV